MKAYGHHRPQQQKVSKYGADEWYNSMIAATENFQISQ